MNNLETSKVIETALRLVYKHGRKSMVLEKTPGGALTRTINMTRRIGWAESKQRRKLEDALVDL